MNQVILRDRHPTPTVEQSVHDLNGSVLFSKLDFNHAFWQIVVSEESQYITTFSSPSGYFRFKRARLWIKLQRRDFPIDRATSAEWNTERDQYLYGYID